MATPCDAIVVGAGPAGATCAAHLAAAGRKVVLLDRARFPRPKVCGDCLNPDVLPILDRLGVRERLTDLPHTVAREVSFHGIGGTTIRFPVANEIVVRRRDFDHMLVTRAVENGVDFREGLSVLRVRPGWTVETDAGEFCAPRLFAADGRNSTVARLVGRLPTAGRSRSALQCHVPRPAWHEDGVRMIFHPLGYGGTACVDPGTINICLVAPGPHLSRLKRHTERAFGLAETSEWRTIAPLDRGDARPLAADGLFLLGDAARVVEPFTGEGIFYAMRSAELAAAAVLAGGDEALVYRRAHAAMYGGRLWVNRLARLAGRHPRLASAALKVLQHHPAPLGRLTAKVVARSVAGG